ncbi:hypothetical protein ACFZCG_39185 [Streptomyces tanashiensis]|uniref:hypothetical protein n=1 Tax=Streptomyces tanashiensis TaxID=67367 RepID=UPI0036E99A32
MATPTTDGTPPTTLPPSGGGQQGGQGGPDPLLSAHATLVCLAAGLIALVCGVLTYLSTGNMAGAVLAGVMAGGASAPVLHKLVGP